MIESVPKRGRRKLYGIDALMATATELRKRKGIDKKEKLFEPSQTQK